MDWYRAFIIYVIFIIICAILGIPFITLVGYTCIYYGILLIGHALSKKR